MDKTLGHLLDRLTEHDLLGKVNIVLLSDHGVTETTRDRVIVLNRILDPTWYITPQLTSIGFIYPNEGKAYVLSTNL